MNESAFIILVILLSIFIFLIIYLIREKRIADAKFLNEQRAHEREIIQLRDAYTQEQQKVQLAHEQLETVFSLLAIFSQSSSEEEVIRELMNISTQLLGARGVSFIPFDDRGQPQAGLSSGQAPVPAIDAWLEYLATPSIRSQCRDCNQYGVIATSCPLMNSTVPDITGMYCLPLASNQREFGILNLYEPDPERIGGEQGVFLKTIMGGCVLALEGIRLRQREIVALRQLQQVHRKNDLSGMLQTMVEDIQASLDSDLAILVINNGNLTTEFLAAGEVSPAEEAILHGILEGTIQSGQPIQVEDLASGQNLVESPLSVISVPLENPNAEPRGALLVGIRNRSGFQPGQLNLLQTIAGQVTILIENNMQMARLEYNTMMQERIRLAREIHDGLAQTLGFLKLQTAQMINYLNKNEIDRLQQALSSSYQIIDETYQDVRGTIDGLRIRLSPDGLSGWLRQVAEEFQDLSGIATSLDLDSQPINLAPEVHAQLIRILQEALNNTRKHASATQVWIRCQENKNELNVMIRDNGKGFLPADELSGTHHGFQGMRERTDLIDGEFQVESHLGEGTTIRINIPIDPAISEPENRPTMSRSI